MNRLNLVYQMDDLLNQCKSCERPYHVQYSVRCEGCDILTQLQEIGEQLEGKQMAKLIMSVDEFIQLKHIEKLSIMKIAEMKGVSDPTVHHWMKKHKAEIDKALNVLNSSPQAHSETKGVSESTRNVETNTLDLLAFQMELESKDSRIEELEGLLAEAEKRIEQLTGCCDDLESEIEQLKNTPSIDADYVKAMQQRTKDLEAELAPIRQLAYLKLKQDLA